MHELRTGETSDSGQQLFEDIQERQTNEMTDPGEQLFEAWDRLSDVERDTILPSLIHDTSWGGKLGPFIPLRPQRVRTRAHD